MRFLILAAAFTWCPPAAAQSTTEARAHYEKATNHFAVGEFAEAAVEYQAAYKLKPDPALLYNAAQSYRLARNHEKALILYRNYLQLYPNEPNADEVRSQIAKLRDSIAASQTTPSPKQNELKEPGASSNAAKPTAPSTNAQPSKTATATSTMARSRGEAPAYKKWWLWTVIGVVVAGGAVTAGLLASRARSSWSNAPDVGPGSSNALVSW